MLEDKDRAQFSAMIDGTEEDYQKISAAFGDFSKTLPDRVLDHLQMLKGDFGGFAVDRLEHSLQTATRAHQDGRDEEYVVCALLHDIGDTLGPANHADVAAVLLEPYVSEANHWMVKHHAIFQGYYFFHYLGLDRNLRDQFKDHPHYARTLEFIEKYDAPAFDPEAEYYELSFFEPMMERVFKEPKQSLYLSDSD